MTPHSERIRSTPIDRIRVTNGYGVRTSALSVSFIGDFDASSEKRKAINRKWEAVYQADAKFQMSRLKAGNHPMRKVLHMQSFYPETIRRLDGKIATTQRSSGRSGGGGGIIAHHLRGGDGRDDVRLPPHQPPQQAAK